MSRLETRRFDGKLDSFLRRSLPSEDYERICTSELCVVVSPEEKRVHRHVVLGHRCLYLTEFPPKSVKVAANLQDVQSICMVRCSAREKMPTLTPTCTHIHTHARTTHTRTHTHATRTHTHTHNAMFSMHGYLQAPPLFVVHVVYHFKLRFGKHFWIVCEFTNDILYLFTQLSLFKFN